MTRVIHIQPSGYTDNMWQTEEGEVHEGVKLPYPFDVVDTDGRILNQNLWNGKPYRVVGFANTPQPGKLDVYWVEVAREPELAMGKYVVTQDKGGGMAVHTTAIQEVKVYDIPADRIEEM